MYVQQGEFRYLVFVLLNSLLPVEGTNSLAKIAERMYLDGYDLRHLVSTAVTVAIKNLLIDAYLSLTRTPDELFLPVAEQERQKLNAKLKREKMLFISDIVGSSGNVAKFLLPLTAPTPVP